jgi:hypothetical protein
MDRHILLFTLYWYTNYVTLRERLLRPKSLTFQELRSFAPLRMTFFEKAYKS